MLKQELAALTVETFNKDIKSCTMEEIYGVLLKLTKDKIEERPTHKGNKKLYYISAEFLIGKLLSNNLINLGIYEEISEILTENGHNMSQIEEIEPEPSLGNGGLGRLAACFLDSIATLGLPGDGIGLNYHFGLFLQKFENNRQKEVPNPWITKESWLTKTDRSFQVPFKDFTLTSTMYDIGVTGYNNGKNQLHLFDVDSVDESLVSDGISFDQEDIKKNLTLFLYPDDSNTKGHLLRIYQQYFMVSNGAQLIIEEAKNNGYDLHKLHEHVVIQINDTHPSMVIPEMIRLLMIEGIELDDAIEIVTNTCAYTNHTILAEALEKWPLSYLEEVVPHLVPIIKELDRRIKNKNTEESISIIDKDGRVHMAHMDIHYGFSVNGVAALHTEILKQSELKPFFDLYPNKFNNKTNGITFRRWLIHCNPKLTKWIEKHIGSGFYKDAALLTGLAGTADNKDSLAEMLTIKAENKKILKDYLFNKQGITIDENSIFDIQIKRLHEYKRQQMNALYIIYKYLEIKKGNLPKTPITMIFGAKAAPAYTIAKDIIHLILCLQELIENDKEVSPYLRVVMVENYNVTMASKLIPACDVSEQISLASKEASGTGNMKFMLNGALTLGTDDGANVEIHELVGDDNIYIFGKSSDTVIDMYAKESYCSKEYYNDPKIEELVDFIISKQLISLGEPLCLCRLYKELIGKDWFMTLLDIKEYIATKEQVFADYEDKEGWSKKVLANISQAGFFSSDRTIEEYNNDIWKLN